jgi:hypothetical protein
METDRSLQLLYEIVMEPILSKRIQSYHVSIIIILILFPTYARSLDLRRKFYITLSATMSTTLRSENRCVLRLRYVDLVASIEVAVDVCSCFTVFSC